MTRPGGGSGFPAAKGLFRVFGSSSDSTTTLYNNNTREGAQMFDFPLHAVLCACVCARASVVRHSAVQCTAMARGVPYRAYCDLPHLDESIRVHYIKVLDIHPSFAHGTTSEKNAFEDGDISARCSSGHQCNTDWTLVQNSKIRATTLYTLYSTVFSPSSPSSYTEQH